MTTAPLPRTPNGKIDLYALYQQRGFDNESPCPGTVWRLVRGHDGPAAVPTRRP